jgi:hypothetical protein
MLRDVKLKMWQSVLLALVISGAVLVLAFVFFFPPEQSLLVPVPIPVAS